MHYIKLIYKTHCYLSIYKKRYKVIRKYVNILQPQKCYLLKDNGTLSLIICITARSTPGGLHCSPQWFCHAVTGFSWSGRVGHSLRIQVQTVSLISAEHPFCTQLIQAHCVLFHFNVLWKNPQMVSNEPCLLYWHR